MKYLVLFSFLSCFVAACNNADKTPDVSGIRVELKLERFDKDFFAIDTANIDAGLTQLQAKYPLFFKDFVGEILGIDSKMIEDGTANTAIKSFLSSYRNLYDSALVTFGNFDQQMADVKKALQFTKYYFPEYKAPTRVISFIGPMDAFYETSFGIQGDIKIENSYFATGLQLHMGKDFPLYKSQEAQAIYPEYISRQFEPDFIAIDFMKIIVDDMFPEKNNAQSLVEQMVQKGKRLFMLSKLLPNVDENKLLGYTTQQWQLCKQNEAVIWNMFIQNSLLQTTDKNIIKNYIGESPKTQEVVNDAGEYAPGNIGSFSGWQIVKKFMSKTPETSLAQLMGKDAESIYRDSKYKP